MMGKKKIEVVLLGIVVMLLGIVVYLPGSLEGKVQAKQIQETEVSETEEKIRTTDLKKTEKDNEKTEKDDEKLSDRISNKPPKESFEYWGSQLNTYERNIYDAILEIAKEKDTKEVTVVMEYPNLWRKGESGVHELVYEMVARAGCAFSFDYPLYWCETYDYQLQVVNEQLTIQITPNPYYEGFWEDIDKNLEEIEKLKEQISHKLETMENGTEDFTICEVILETICERMEYSYNTGYITENKSEDDGISHTLSAALLEQYQGRGVCSAYSGLFMTLCNEFSIPCIQICNDLEEGMQPHSWNAVYLDGNWWQVDASWADTSEKIDWDYFLYGGKVAFSQHRIGNKLVCEAIETPFENVSFPDTFYYEIPEDEVVLEIPDSVVYDAFSPKSQEEIRIGATDLWNDRAVLENIEFTVQNVQILRTQESYESGTESGIFIWLDGKHTAEASVRMYSRYTGQDKTRTLSITAYPVITQESSQNTDIWDVECKNTVFQTDIVLQLPGDFYRFLSDASNASVLLSRVQLESMEEASEITDVENGQTGLEGGKQYDFSVLFWEPDQEESVSVQEMESNGGSIQKDVSRFQKKYASYENSRMIFAIQIPEKVLADMGAVYTIQLPESLTAQYAGKEVYAKEGGNSIKKLTTQKIQILDSGEIVLTAASQNLYFYETDFKGFWSANAKRIVMIATVVALGLLGTVLFLKADKKSRMSKSES